MAHEAHNGAFLRALRHRAEDHGHAPPLLKKTIWRSRSVTFSLGTLAAWTWKTGRLRKEKEKEKGFLFENGQDSKVTENY